MRMIDVDKIDQVMPMSVNLLLGDGSGIGKYAVIYLPVPCNSCETFHLYRALSNNKGVIARYDDGEDAVEWLDFAIDVCAKHAMPGQATTLAAAMVVEYPDFIDPVNLMSVSKERCTKHG